MEKESWTGWKQGKFINQRQYSCWNQQEKDKAQEQESHLVRPSSLGNAICQCFYPEDAIWIANRLNLAAQLSGLVHNYIENRRPITEFKKEVEQLKKRINDSSFDGMGTINMEKLTWTENHPFAVGYYFVAEKGLEHNPSCIQMINVIAKIGRKNDIKYLDGFYYIGHPMYTNPEQFNNFYFAGPISLPEKPYNKPFQMDVKATPSDK